MEVAVTAFFIATEDDDGIGTGGEIVEEFLGFGEMVRSLAEIAAEEGGRPGWGVGVSHTICDGLCWSLECAVAAAGCVRGIQCRRGEELMPYSSGVTGSVCSLRSGASFSFRRINQDS